MSNRMADRAPDVDNSDSGLQEAFSILGHVIVNASDTGCISLVDVNSFLQKSSQRG